MVCTSENIDAGEELVLIKNTHPELKEPCVSHFEHNDDIIVSLT